MAQIPLQVCENFPGILYAVYFNALSKMKKTFELKSVSVEYFEDLLSRSSYPNNFTGDTKSYALLSFNNLAALSVKNESWIEMSKYDILDESQSKKENTKVVQQFEKQDSLYLIQCCAVSSIKSDSFIYVTNEKYFNILQHFNMSITTGPIFKVKVVKSLAKIQPPVAKILSLGFIEPSIEIGISDVKVIIETFFKTPRYLKINEVFQVNLKKLIPHCPLNFFNIENIYFKVLNISENLNEMKDCITSENIGFYVSDEHAEINVVKTTQSYTPAIFTKYKFLNKELGYEISMCPAGLKEYNTKLEGLFETFLNGNNLKFKPMILLSGPKGSGKKTVLNCIALRFGLKLYSVDCFDYVALDGTAVDSKFSGLVQKLKKLSPVVLLLNNIELLGRDEQYCENVSVIEIFKKQIDKLFKDVNYPVIIVALSNQKTQDIVSPVQRMFIQTVSFSALKKDEASALLQWLLYEVGMTSSSEVLRSVVDKVNGYLFSDITKLVRNALKFQREDMDLPEGSKLSIREEHWEKGIKIMEALYSDSIGSAKVPCVHWEDVGGLDNLKEEITLALEFPTKYPELMTSGLTASGFLFYGPPGTGKTLMAKTVATEFNYNFLSVKGPELISMYVGESEKNVREVFQRARDAAPCIIFFDELDSLAPNRGRSSGVVTDRIVSQLLAEMDGLESNKGIFIIGATNRPDLVDPALLRPGRFDKMFYVGVCESVESKYSVLKALTRRFSLGEDVDLKAIVEHLPGQVTGADIYSICYNAWLEAARKCIYKMDKGEKIKLPVTVSLHDFEDSLSKFVPSLTPDVVGYYEKYRNMQK